jgi:diguanylate cyclase (GGDEF)-like protein
MHYIITLLERRSKGVLWLISIALVAAIAVIDYASGTRFSFNTFYLAPIFVAAWCLSRNSGYCVALLSVGAWLMTELTDSDRMLNGTQLAWNSLMRLALYAIVVHLTDTLHAALRREQQLARTDPLTNLATRRHFYDLIATELARLDRTHQPLSLVYFDLDNFKNVNDTHGHHSGDNLLMAVAHALRTNVRPYDTVARLGGDEFAVLLPETDDRRARLVVERLHGQINLITAQQAPVVSASVGVITFPEAPATVDQAIASVDQLMYMAKHSGKGRVVYGVPGSDIAPRSMAQGA